VNLFELILLNLSLSSRKEKTKSNLKDTGETNSALFHEGIRHIYNLHVKFFNHLAPLLKYQACIIDKN